MTLVVVAHGTDTGPTSVGGDGVAQRLIQHLESTGYSVHVAQDAPLAGTLTAEHLAVNSEGLTAALRCQAIVGIYSGRCTRPIPAVVAAVAAPALKPVVLLWHSGSDPSSEPGALPPGAERVPEGPLLAPDAPPLAQQHGFEEGMEQLVTWLHLKGCVPLKAPQQQQQQQQQPQPQPHSADAPPLLPSTAPLVCPGRRLPDSCPLAWHDDDNSSVPASLPLAPASSLDSTLDNGSHHTNAALQGAGAPPAVPPPPTAASASTAQRPPGAGRGTGYTGDDDDNRATSSAPQGGGVRPPAAGPLTGDDDDNCCGSAPQGSGTGVLRRSTSRRASQGVAGHLPGAGPLTGDDDDNALREAGMPPPSTSGRAPLRTAGQRLPGGGPLTGDDDDNRFAGSSVSQGAGAPPAPASSATLLGVAGRPPGAGPTDTGDDDDNPLSSGALKRRQDEEARRDEGARQEDQQQQGAGGAAQRRRS